MIGSLSILAIAVLAGGGDGPIRTEGPVVIVNEVPVVRLKAPTGGMSPDARASRVAATLDGAKGLVTVKKLGPEAGIFVGDIHCLTVTPEDAHRDATDVLSLAGSWAGRLRTALDLPPLKLSVSSLELPVGATRTVTLVGSKAASRQLELAAPTVAHVTRTAEGFSVHAVRAGSGSVQVRVGGDSITLPIVVRPVAAAFPQILEAEVSGDPAAGSAVGGAVASALKGKLAGVEGAKFEYSVPTAGALGSGRDRTYTVSVRATGSGAVPNYGKVEVHVRNLSLPRVQDAELWYSNDPEIISSAAPLFSATLHADRPARLLYHHVNSATQPLYIRVEAINDSDRPARVLVMPGDSAPTPDPVWAGLAAGDQYFHSWITGSGEVVTIPPKSTLPISLRRLGPGDTASGLCGLRLLPDSPELLVRTDAWPPFNLAPGWRGATTTSAPWREVGCPPINDFDRAAYQLSDHIYPNPFKEEDLAYEVGGRYGTVRIGQRAIVRSDTKRLDGNFGVVYDIKGSLKNPTTQATDVELAFEASAGYSGGLFELDGQYIRVNPIKPKVEQRLAKFHLAPGASRAFQLVTLPLSGSSYPATVTLRPIVKSK